MERWFTAVRRPLLKAAERFNDRYSRMRWLDESSPPKKGGPDPDV
jgi:hypothetical protein